MNDNNIAKIPLTGKRGAGKSVIVDSADFGWLSKYKWHLHSGGYAEAIINNNCFLMHRLIMHSHKGQYVDHHNGNKLDNRRLNLRLCSNSQNMMNARLYNRNTTGFKGIYLHKKRRGTKIWQAKICLGNKLKSLGYFYNAKDAAKAYDDAAILVYGEFALTNQRLGLFRAGQESTEPPEPEFPPEF